MKTHHFHILAISTLATLATATAPLSSGGPPPIPSSHRLPIPTGTPKTPCIKDSEVPFIAHKWVNSFATNGSSNLPSAVTQDIHIYDEGATNGSTAAYVSDYQELNDTINASAYGGGGVTNVTYEILSIFHDCEHIALRWQEHAVTTADVGYGSTVPAGKEIEFKGTDLLTIDLVSRKVKNVTTSSDLLNYYRALGYPLGVESTT